MVDIKLSLAPSQTLSVTHVRDATTLVLQLIQATLVTCSCKTPVVRIKQDFQTIPGTYLRIYTLRANYEY